MFNISKKVKERITNSLQRYLPIIEAAQTNDVNETDTVTIIKDFFSDCFGYDKYSELTSEFVVKSTYCDLAVRIDNKVKLLVEIKAPGVELKENQIKQAVDYSANSGVEWVVLTNAVDWKLFKIEFKQPIETKLVLEFSILKFNPKNENAHQIMYVFSKEGLSKSSLLECYDKTRATSKYLIGAILVSDSVLSVIKKEIKKIHEDVKVGEEALAEILSRDIIKREIFDSDQFKDNQKIIKKQQAREQKKRDQAKLDDIPVQIPDKQEEITINHEQSKAS